MALIDDFHTSLALLSRSLKVVPALLIAGCVPFSRSTPPEMLQVLSYNIEYGHEGLDSVAKVIRDQRPDLVGLQEVDVHWSARSNFVDQAAALAEKTGMQYRFARIYQIANADPTKPPREFGVALLSKYPITAFVNREITRHSTQDSAAAPAPMPGLLDATVDVNGRKVRFLNVHLDYRSDPTVRAKQVAEIVAYLGSDTTLTILTGDLNATPDAPELQPLFHSLHNPWDGPNPGLTYSTTKLEKKIDYVLFSGGFCPGVGFIPKAYASDHFPLVMDLKFGKC